MKAIQIETFGGPEVLRLKELPVLQPGPGELLVKVSAASVNPVDYKIRSGKYPAVKEDKLPYVLGRDACGVVEMSNSDLFKTGDVVYGVAGIERGSYAEYVVLKETELARKPVSLENATAATVPLAGLTAWQGLFRYGLVEAGQRVLIHAGSGGVGHFAIQFAKARGAYVVTTVSKDHAAFVRQIRWQQHFSRFRPTPPRVPSNGICSSYQLITSRQNRLQIRLQCVFHPKYSIFDLQTLFNWSEYIVNAREFLVKPQKRTHSVVF